jgi:hypothetical protein
MGTGTGIGMGIGMGVRVSMSTSMAIYIKIEISHGFTPVLSTFEVQRYPGWSEPIHLVD